MKYVSVFVIFVMLASAAAAQDERSALSIAIAQPLMSGTLTATGRIRAVTSAKLGPRVAGHITEFGADQDGQMLDVGMSVKKDQVLFRLNQTTFNNTRAMAEATLASAQAALDNLTAPTRQERVEAFRQAVAEVKARIEDRAREEERYRRLVEVEKTMPARKLEETQTDLRVLRALVAAAEARLKEAEAGATKTEIAVMAARLREAEVALKIATDDLRDSTFRAPFDGVITRRFKSLGDYVTNVPPTEVLEVVSLEKLEVELRLPEAYYTAVQSPQTRVVVRSPLLETALTAPIARVISEIDPLKGTFGAVVSISGQQRGGFVPGAFVTAELSLGKPLTEVIIPIRALTVSEGKTSVFISENGRMVRRHVELGDRLTEGVVVRSGLRAGEKVLIGPAAALREGAPVPEGLREAQ